MVLGSENQKDQIDAIRTGHGNRSSLDGVIENLIQWAQQSLGDEEILRAREEFLARVGKVFSDEPHFLPFMSFFLDYLLFERPASRAIWESLQGHFPDASPTDVTLFTVAARSKPWPSPATKAPPVLELEGCRHSIFEVLQVTRDHAVFKDLMNDEKVEVFSRGGESFVWMAKKDYLQCHLYQWGGKHYIGDGVLGHLGVVRRAIRKRLKVHKKEQKRSNLDFLLNLVFAKLKHLRLKTTNPVKIYSEVC